MTVPPVTLPPVRWQPCEAFSSRNGATPSLIVVHRWGTPDWRTARLPGVVAYLSNPANQVSAHYVYAGETGPDAGQCVQLVARSKKAWTEAHFNPIGISIESGDRIWQGNDLAGFQRLARIVAWHLNHYKLPAHYVLPGELARRPFGFTRHADLGELGGGHTACPTTDLNQWHRFCTLVQQELRRGGFRREWGRE